MRYNRLIDHIVIHIVIKINEPLYRCANEHACIKAMFCDQWQNDVIKCSPTSVRKKLTVVLFWV